MMSRYTKESVSSRSTRDTRRTRNIRVRSNTTPKININNVIKLIACIIAFVFVLIIIIPTTVTYFYGNISESYALVYEISGTNTGVSRVFTQTTMYNIPYPQFNMDININIDAFEDYLVRVTAAEMYISFEMEALKAQAVAARTFALWQINRHGNIPMEYIGQAFLTDEEMRERFGNNFDSAYARLRQAVDGTRGEVIVHNNQLIEAVFHATSGGYTEYSQNFWIESRPYLVSVESRGDKHASGFLSSREVERTQAVMLLQQQLGRELPHGVHINIVDRSRAGYVMETSIDGSSLTGRQIRELFSLRSSNFTVYNNVDNITFVTRGYGHGVGMSQNGANYMARNGFNYIEILQHYYNNVEIIRIYD